jgi:DnaJ-class molecular chaperone
MEQDIVCPECGGTGHDEEELPCDTCDGFGRIAVEDL